MSASSPSGSRGLPQADLGEDAARAAACTLCRLGTTRTQAVYGSGDPQAELMFVGDAPGYHEDKVGETLVGDAARLFDGLLKTIGLDRSQVYITQVVKCRPPRNRSAFPDEMEACEGYLFRQISSVQPKIICTLGSTPLRLFTRRLLNVSDERGKPRPMTIAGQELTVFPTLHPGAALYTKSLSEVMKQDFVQLGRLLRTSTGTQAGQETARTDDESSRAPAPTAPDESPQDFDPAGEPQLSFEV